MCVYTECVCVSQELRLVRALDDACEDRRKKSKTAYNLRFNNREAYNRAPTPEPGPRMPKPYRPRRQTFEQWEAQTEEVRERQYARAEEMAEAVMFGKSTIIPDCKEKYDAAEDGMAHYDQDPVILSPTICFEGPPKSLHYRRRDHIDPDNEYIDPRNLGPLSNTVITLDCDSD